MELNLIRTFLEVCHTRHFGRAAENLHLTTSAISARIKALEEQLGVSLFLRLRNGIEPTPIAERLMTQFRGLVTTWDQVRHQVSAETSSRPTLTIAASFGVWESLDSGWIKYLLSFRNETRLSLETLNPNDVLRKLQQGSVDLGLTTEQLSETEIVSKKIFDLKLRLMSDVPGQTVAEALSSDYLHIEWSTSFNTQFQSAFPDYVAAKINVSNARLASILLADFPGAAYLPTRIVERMQPQVEMHQVLDAPELCIPIFVSYVNWTTKLAAIQPAIDFLSQSETE